MRGNSSLVEEKVEVAGVALWCDISTDQLHPLVSVSHCQTVFAAVHGLAHPGIWATKRMVASRFVWPGLATRVAEWCRDCSWQGNSAGEDRGAAHRATGCQVCPCTRGLSGAAAGHCRGAHSLAHCSRTAHAVAGSCSYAVNVSRGLGRCICSPLGGSVWRAAHHNNRSRSSVYLSSVEVFVQQAGSQAHIDHRLPPPE